MLFLPLTFTVFVRIQNTFRKLRLRSRVFPPTGVRFPAPTAENRNYNWALPIGSHVISHSPVEFHGTDTDLTENDGCGLFSGENILPALVWLVALLYFMQFILNGH